MNDYKKLIEKTWRGLTAQEICSKLKKKLNNTIYQKLNDLAEEENYEVYEVRYSDRYKRKAFRKKLPKFEFGVLGISLIIILFERKDWISIEELGNIINQRLVIDITAIAEKLEDLKDCGFIIEDNNAMFYKLKAVK